MEAKNLVNDIVIVNSWFNLNNLPYSFLCFRYKEGGITKMSSSDSNSVHESELDTRKFPICMLRLDFYGILSNWCLAIVLQLIMS